MSALYSGQPVEMAQGMVGGLMKALGTSDARATMTPRGVTGRVITWENFEQAAMKVEDLDAMLTLVRDRSSGGEPTVAPLPPILGAAPQSRQLRSPRCP